MIELYRPTNSLTHTILPRYQEELQRLQRDGRSKAPFQFMIPIMAAMWLDLQRGWIEARAASWKLEGREVKVMNMRELWANGVVQWGGLDPALKLKGADKVDHALKCPLRAIAYFSWEESGRLFLVRRVFPTYFNFLSYSHCPEGWGALGTMVNELKNGRRDKQRSEYFHDSFMPITRIEGFSQSALPFLSEVTRLKYKSIFTMPIVRRWGRFDNTSDLLGAFVFFVHTKHSLPTDRRDAELAPWFAETNKGLVKVLASQEKLFRRSRLAGIWRHSAKNLRQKGTKNEKTDIGIFEIRITEGPGCKKRIDLKGVVSNLIASLSTNEFHTIFDRVESDKLKPGVVVLVAKSELIAIEKVKAAVMRAVGAACDEEPDKFVVRLRKL